MEAQHLSHNQSIYSLTSPTTLPEWLPPRTLRNLSKRSIDIRRRIELLQDFSFPASSNRLRTTLDGRYLLATGTYAPRIRCFELDELGMKFERYLDSEVVDLVCLGVGGGGGGGGGEEGYGKFCVLQSDRTLVIHAPYGKHETVRLPGFGRGLVYDSTSCDLMVASRSRKGEKGEVYRLNLEEGRFLQSLEYGDGDGGVGASSITVSPAHALMALGCDDGIVRLWDNRSPDVLDPFCSVDVASSTTGYGFSSTSSSSSFGGMGGGGGKELTSLAFDRSGLHLAVGSATGVVALYDVRSSKPLCVKEHRYGLPIHTVAFHEGRGGGGGSNGSGERCVLSGDKKCVKAWRCVPSATTSPFSLSEENDQNPTSSSNSNPNNPGGMGSVICNIEGTADFTHFLTSGDTTDPSGRSSGLILCAGEQPKVQAFYCPVLGSAPRWCSFLDGITEELEERDHDEGGEGMDPLTGVATGGGGGGGGTIYEDYKFLTRQEIETLGVANLIGTPLLRGYMHGFFVDLAFYHRLRAVANPFEYEEYRKKKIKEKMEAKRASRISPKDSNSSKGGGGGTKGTGGKTVNVELAKRLEETANKGSGGSKSSQAAKKLMEDERFSRMFRDDKFEIDEDGEDFKLRNPSGTTTAGSSRRDRDDIDSDDDDDDDEEEEEEKEEEEDRYEEEDEEEDGFVRIGASNYEDEDEDGGWGSQNDDESNNDHDTDEDTDEEEDGIRGGTVRGENYHEVRALRKQSKNHQHSKANKKNQKKTNKERRSNERRVTVYEDRGEASEGDVLAVGLGGGGRSSDRDLRRKKRREETELSLAERLEAQKKNTGVVVATTGSGGRDDVRSRTVRGEGVVKEVTFVPRGSKKEEREGKDGEEDAKGGRRRRRAKEGQDDDNGGGGDSKRKRRGISGLGLKTPFKNQR